jgi:hypothetical protein
MAFGSTDFTLAVFSDFGFATWDHTGAPEQTMTKAMAATTEGTWNRAFFWFKSCMACHSVKA